jgi:hypothetical protein
MSGSAVGSMGSKTMGGGVTDPGVDPTRLVPGWVQPTANTNAAIKQTIFLSIAPTMLFNRLVPESRRHFACRSLVFNFAG